MATSVYLSVGDGATSDYLNLLDGAKHKVLTDGLQIPTPDPGATARAVLLRMLITGSDTDTMMANYRAIETKLRQARDAAGPNGRGTPVSLGVQFKDASNMVYFDVLDGALAPETIRTERNWMIAILSLACLPLARGAAVNDSESATITNGDSGYLFRASVPGDAPALVQMKLIDKSTNSKYINRVRLGARAFEDMASTDFDSVLDDTANSPGTSGAEAGTVGGNRSRVTTSESWQDVADFTGGTAAYNNGEFDLFARVRDSTALGTPTNLAYTSTSAGSLSTGTYTIKVTTIDGSANESVASDPLTVTGIVNGTRDRIALTWTVGAGAANHRVYYKRDTDAWEYFATGSAAGSYNLDTNAGTASDPPTQASSSAAGAQVRALVGMSSLTTTYAGRAVTPPLANSQWCLVYLGRFHLPPISRGQGLSQAAWKATVQAKSAGTSTPTLDVDALWLFPADTSQCVAEYRGLALATLREWVISTNRFGYTSGVLRSTADQTEQGQLDVTGEFYLPPGDCLVCVAVDVASGVSDVTDAKYTLTLAITPRYRYVRGS